MKKCMRMLMKKYMFLGLILNTDFKESAEEALSSTMLSTSKTHCTFVLYQKHGDAQ